MNSPQAWIITKEVIEEGKVIQSFTALLDYTISSSAMLRIVETLYQFNICCDDNSEKAKTEQATHIYLNDGSPRTDVIICGYNPALHACHAYNIILTRNSNGFTLYWKEPHILIENDIREIQYWEEFSVTIPPTIENSISDNTN